MIRSEIINELNRHDIRFYTHGFECKGGIKIRALKRTFVPCKPVINTWVNVTDFTWNDLQIFLGVTPGIEYNKKVEFSTSAGYFHNQVGFMAWKEIPYGVVFVPASDYDRKEFGPGVFRVAKDEMHYELICRIDPKKRRLYFVDNIKYLENELVWQDYILLTKLIINNKDEFERGILCI